MQCQYIKGDDGNQCRQKAVTGFNMCRAHGWSCKYFIKISWQEKPGDHWTKRKKAVWPILFITRERANAHMSSVNVFKNMRKRKLSAYVQSTKRTFEHELLRKV